MSIREVTDEVFHKYTNEGFALVDFYSDTCNPCKALALNLNEVANDFPFININKVNVPKSPKVSEKFGVMAVPTIIFMKNGKEVDRHVGLMSVEEIKEKISTYYY